jgi:hypothetical protein
MKLITHPLLYLVLASLVLSASCKKNKIEEKKETVTINGQTFGCRVDGVPFIADKWDYGLNIPPIQIQFSRSTYGGVTLLVTAKRQEGAIFFFLNKPLKPGNLTLNEYTKPYPVWDPPKNHGDYIVRSNDSHFITGPTSQGNVNFIVMDTLTYKVEAHFDFTGTNPMTGNQIKITDGYFKNF